MREITFMHPFLTGVENLVREMIREEVRTVLSEQVLPRQIPDEKAATNIVPEDRLLNASEVAQILGVSPQRVYELARQRKSNGFPVVTLGERQYRFSRNHLTTWLENASIGRLS